VDDDEVGLESISDPGEEVGVDDGNVSSAPHAPSSNSSHVAASTFSYTHAHPNSNSITQSASTSSSGAARSEKVDTEEDPLVPLCRSLAGVSI
jgi:hypothetical protein